MTDYSKLSDFDINAAVSMALRSQSANPESKYVVINDYCNNPADAWPIILGNKISIVKDMKGLWWADANAYWIDGLEWQIDGEPDENPLRAAMIAFLKMQDASHANP